MKIFLPRRASSAQGVAEREAPEDLPRGGGERILVTEDDADVRAYIVQTLVELGYEVIQAPDGPTALAIMSQNRFNFFLQTSSCRA